MENDYDDFENEFNDEDGSGQGRRKIEMTDFHRNRIKDTLKKMDDNLVQPQKSVGRVFTGAGFASKPEKITYKDFEVGSPMSITIELTNISYSFNSFKLLPLEDEVIDFFEIDYRPCGRVPAGISTTMTLKFTPMVDKDYFSHLKLLSETGMVLVPIECLTKKCVINILTPVLDFGEVILGQQVHKLMSLDNNGALACIYTFLDCDKNSLVENEIISTPPSEQENLFTGSNSDDPVGESSSSNYEDFVERKTIVNKNNFLKEEEMDLNPNHKGKKFFVKQITYHNKGTIDSYCKKTFNFILDAKFIGEYEIKLQMKIEYKNKCDFKEIMFKFKVIDLPIYPEKNNYNLDYLIEDNIFREKITLYNNSNISYKLQVYNHKEINEFLDFNPNLGYIQANSSFDIWVKLKISKHIHSLNEFFKTSKEGEVNFPVKIVIHNITIPLIVILNFFVTRDSLDLSKTFLNFDRCFIDEKTQFQISMENKSLLPMKYGFIMLPKEFSVKNNIDYILSKEKIFCEVMYETKDNYSGHREGDVFCKVITDELTVHNVNIKYHVELLTPDIEIKPKNILFPCLPTGERKSIRVLISNKSHREDYLCEWLTPPYCVSGLKIMPKVFQLSPDKYVTCVIEYQSEFRPYGPFTHEEVEKEIGVSLQSGLKDEEEEGSNLYDQQNPLFEEKIKKEIDSTIGGVSDPNDKKKKQPEKKETAPAKKLDPKKDKKQIEDEERRKKDDEERILKEIEDKKATRIQNFNRQKELNCFGAEILSFDDADGFSEHSRFVIPLFYKSITGSEMKKTFLEISTTCVEKCLIFSKNSVEFGEVSVKTRKTINISLHNNSNKPAMIKMKPLIVSNCFQIINSVKEIPPNSVYHFLVEFFPLKDLPYFDEFCVYTEETQSTVPLTGKGVQPEISVNVDEGIFFMGNSCVNNTLEKNFEITNKSSFNVDFEIAVLKSGKKNRNGLKPFTFIPYKGELLANAKVQVKVIFQGDHQDFQNFCEHVLIDVANQKKPNYLYVSAACWNRQVYWREFFTPSFPDNVVLSRVIDQDYFIEPLKLKSLSCASNNEKVLLEFIKSASNNSNENMTKRKLIIGCCKLNDPKNEKAGAYEVTIPKEDIYFTCDNSKGSLNSGSETVISFTYKKPAKDPLLKDIECLNDIGMWVTTKAELKISGGFLSPSVTDLVLVEVLLKAYVEQI